MMTIANSMFRNFDPEQFDADAVVPIPDKDRPFDLAFLPILVSNLLASCAPWRKVEGKWGRQNLTNAGFVELKREVDGLARIGYFRRREIWWMSAEDAVDMKFERFSVRTWADEGRTLSGVDEPTESQIAALQGLLDVDDALTIHKAHGWHGVVVDFLLSAAFCESEANEAARPWLDADEGADTLSANGTVMAAKRWAKDRAQREAANRLMAGYYFGWLKNPENYANQDEFALDMEEKVGLKSDGRPLYTASTIRVKILPRLKRSGLPK